MKLYNDEQFVARVCDALDTRDKRFMFLRLFFPRVVHSVNLECATRDSVLDILSEISRRGFSDRFRAKFNEHF